MVFADWSDLSFHSESAAFVSDDNEEVTSGPSLSADEKEALGV